MRAMLFVPPMVQLLIFGYAVNMDVERGRIAWMDQDRTPESRELLAGFQGSPRLEVAAWPEASARGATHARGKGGNATRRWGQPAHSSGLNQDPTRFSPR